MPGPKPPAAPKAPTASKPGQKKAGRYSSKTGNSKCSEAMSLWQKAIRSGTNPGKEVYAQLAQCRASVRATKQASAAASSGKITQTAANAIASRQDSRIERGLATKKSRNERLAELLSKRSARTISDADRAKAAAIASKVTGNAATGPSKGLLSLQRKGAKLTGLPAPARAKAATKRASKPKAAVPAPAQAAPAPAPPPVSHRLPDADMNRVLANRGRTPDGRSAPAATPAGKIARARSAAAHRLLKLRNQGEGKIASIMRKQAMAAGKRPDPNLSTRLRGQEIMAQSSNDIRDDLRAAADLQALKAQQLVWKVRQSSEHASNRQEAALNKMNVMGNRSMIGPQMTQAQRMAARVSSVVGRARDKGLSNRSKAQNHWYQGQARIFAHDAKNADPALLKLVSQNMTFELKNQGQLDPDNVRFAKHIMNAGKGDQLVSPVTLQTPAQKLAAKAAALVQKTRANPGNAAAQARRNHINVTGALQNVQWLKQNPSAAQQHANAISFSMTNYGTQNRNAQRLVNAGMGNLVTSPINMMAGKRQPTSGSQLPAYHDRAQAAAAKLQAKAQAKANKAAGVKTPRTPKAAPPPHQPVPGYMGPNTFDKSNQATDDAALLAHAQSLRASGVSSDSIADRLNRLKARAQSENMTVAERLNILKGRVNTAAASAKVNADPTNANPVYRSGVSKNQWHSSGTDNIVDFDASYTQAHVYGKGIYTDSTIYGSRGYGPNHYLLTAKGGSIMNTDDTRARTVQVRRSVKALAERTKGSVDDVMKGLKSGTSAHHPDWSVVFNAAHQAQKSPGRTLTAMKAGHIPYTSIGSNTEGYKLLGKAGISGMATNSNSGVDAAHSDTGGGRYHIWFNKQKGVKVTKAGILAGNFDKHFKRGVTAAHRTSIANLMHT